MTLPRAVIDTSTLISALIAPAGTAPHGSVWDALADTPGQAANLEARAELMQQIAVFVKRQGWTQVEAAGHHGVTQPRINDLLRGVSLAVFAGCVSEYFDGAGLSCARVELEAA